jgi:uncharacterized protein YbgA (DUF1722 family)
MALAFAPLALVRQTFHILDAASDPRLAPLFHYYNQEWILSIQPRMWNVYQVNTRTNNNLEGWHSRFQKIVARHRPNLWQLLEAMLQEQAATEVALQQVAAGRHVHTGNCKYKRVKKQLKRLLSDYRHGRKTLTQYITGVTYNLAQYQ